MEVTAFTSMLQLLRAVNPTKGRERKQVFQWFNLMLVVSRSPAQSRCHALAFQFRSGNGMGEPPNKASLNFDVMCHGV